MSVTCINCIAELYIDGEFLGFQVNVAVNTSTAVESIFWNGTLKTYYSMLPLFSTFIRFVM